MAYSYSNKENVHFAALQHWELKEAKVIPNYSIQSTSTKEKKSWNQM